ncbi:AMP-binding protein [Blastochloris sulfoviridis]|uniref:AMP-binding protein n=1 Tax=Blastochloris sulfoviridis TaxID=50712 RepID=A0A5M6HWT7_9HYPH|nr:AMP-binding protein [Blastochloris sulfoviridis]KAA5600382.1 AMP-binding protein [Blastochloris sulfoviridis]
MILERDGSGSGLTGRVTLDQIFRRVAAERPEAVALAERVGGEVRRLTYARVEHAVSVLASRLVALGLPQDSVVALQGGTGMVQVVALLAALRAGLIAMMVPELWREADLTPAIEGCGTRALISLGPSDDLPLTHCRAAAEVFSVRFVCVMQDEAPDGVVPLGSLESLVDGEVGRLPGYRSGNPAEHVAVLTWDVGPDGPYVVARSHQALIAGAVPVLLAGRLDLTTALVSTIAPSSFAGLAASVVVWLLTGGSLMLAEPADTATVVETAALADATHLLVPAGVGSSLSAEGLFARCGDLRGVLLLNRAPEQAPAPWHAEPICAIDLTAWGEAALLARRREGPEARAAIPTRAHAAAGADPVAASVAGHRTLQGTLAVSGAMVPSVAYPVPAGTGLPLVADSAYDTGWTCHPDPGGAGLISDAPPRGVARVGGYRVSLRDAEAKLSKLADAPVEVAALPHRVLGQRVVATTEGKVDPAAAAALPLVGVSPAKAPSAGTASSTRTRRPA